MKVRVGLKLRIIFILLPLIQASCISTKRTIPVDARPLAALTASRADLLHSLEDQSKRIHTLQGTIALDASSGGNAQPRKGWAAFRRLPLAALEFDRIARNVAPYLR